MYCDTVKWHPATVATAQLYCGTHTPNPLLSFGIVGGFGVFVFLHNGLGHFS